MYIQVWALYQCGHRHQCQVVLQHVFYNTAIVITPTSSGFSVHMVLYYATLLLNYIYVAHIAHPYEVSQPALRRTLFVGASIKMK